MPPINYSKWDNLEDSDDDEHQTKGKPTQGTIQPNVPPSGGGASSAGEDQKKKATVTAGFVVRTMAAGHGVPLYINICSSPAVPGGGMTTKPDAGGLSANMPYIAGDPRQDHDGETTCIVVEFIFAPDTLKHAAANKQAHKVCIDTALAVLGQHYDSMKIDQQNWSLFEREEIKERSGAYFFAPGKMDLGAVE